MTMSDNRRILLIDDRPAIHQDFRKILARAEVLENRGNQHCDLGLAIFPADGTDVSALLKNADIAMYRAKALKKKEARS